MPRDMVNVVYQLGAETTPGTAVPADKRLPGVSFDCRPDLRTVQFRGNGSKTTTGNQQIRNMSGGDFEGLLDYNHLLYLVAGLIGDPDGVSTAGSVNTWVCKPNSVGKDTGQKTYTLQFGDSSGCEQAAHLQIANLTISINREGANNSGSFFAKKLTTTTLTTSPTTVPQIPVNINEINVYVDSTFANIGTTKLTDCLGFDLEITDKYKPYEVLNTDFPDFKSSSEIAFEVKCKLMGENNSQLKAIYTAMAGSGSPTRYIRCEMIGPALGAGFYKITIDLAAKLTGAPFEDMDGVWGQTLEVIGCDDVDFGGYLKFTIQNALSAL